MSANNLINFWDQAISRWPFSGHFEFCTIYLTQEIQNDWTINIKQNLMSHTRITHDKFHNKKSKVAASRPFFIIFFYTILEILHDSWSKNFCFLMLHIAIVPQFYNSDREITEGCFRVRFRTTLSSYYLKLELLTQFPDSKLLFIYFRKLFFIQKPGNWISTTNYFINFNSILFVSHLLGHVFLGNGQTTSWFWEAMGRRSISWMACE